MMVAKEKVVLERASRVIKQSDLTEEILRDLFYNEVLEVIKD